MINYDEYSSGVNDPLSRANSENKGMDNFRLLKFVVLKCLYRRR